MLERYMAKIPITFDENGIPNRVATGPKTTIKFPHSDFYGSPEDFKWSTNPIEAQYQIVKQSLQRNGITDLILGASHVVNHDGVQLAKMEFVLIARVNDQIKFIWQKYESVANGSGQNHVFVNDTRMKMSWFVAMTPEQQDELIEPCILRRTMRVQGLM